MPPKKAATAAPSKKAAVAPAHASYKDMIKEAILNLKERNGSSRQAIKKYVKANNKVTITSEAQFDSMFNKALKSGVEKGDFTQPKGTSGPVKLAKKESKPAAAPKPAPAPKKEVKETKPKVAAPKKAAPKKTATKAAPAKKAPAPKKAATTKTKANTAKPRTKKTTKTPAVAPAVTEVPTVLKKTKSGRVTKTKAPEKKTPAKKAATKKSPAKKATPKKAAA